MKPRILALVLIPFFSAPALHAQEQASSSLWAMIQQGGWAMYPLALCSLTLFYIAIHCYRETRPKNFAPDALVHTLGSHFSSADIAQAQATARASDTLLGRSLSSAFPKLDPAAPEQTIEAFENEIASALSIEENAISQWTHYLSVVANIAPMIGLLGTVSGMIGGFQTMATGGMGRPELFAGDIGEALITTATGLCIGIPAMVAHSIFNNRLQTAITQTTRQANALIDKLPKR